MSQKAYTYATTKDTGNPARQLLLYVIAEHVNVETGATYCSIKTLMAETKIRSDRTLRNHLRILERDGFIARAKRYRTNGSQTTDNLQLVGFLEWSTKSSVNVVDAAARITGGAGSFDRQELPEGAARITGGAGSLSTGPEHFTEPRELNTQTRKRAKACVGRFDLKVSEAAQPEPQPETPATPTPAPKAKPMVLTAALKAEARKLAPGRDIDDLYNEWREWIDTSDEPPVDHDRAFLGFCKRKGPHKAVRFKSSAPAHWKPQFEPLVPTEDEVIVTRLEAGWGPWMDHIRALDPETAKQAEKGFAIAACGKRPNKNSAIPRILQKAADLTVQANSKKSATHVSYSPKKPAPDQMRPGNRHSKPDQASVFTPKAKKEILAHAT